MAAGAEARQRRKQQQQHKHRSQSWRRGSEAEMSRRWKANAVFTCVTFTGVKLQHRRALRTSAGVSTRPEETEMAAYIFTRVGY